jgi:uncharacterized membrane protein YgdD (TMEM256/DUF423 family)
MNFNANSPWVLLCGILGASGVALGAVAAHALSDPQAASAVQLASTYQLIHTITILVLLMAQGTMIRIIRLTMLLGIVLFAGAIYAKYLLGITALGALAPIGGLLLIMAWLALAASWFIPQPAKR